MFLVFLELRDLSYSQQEDSNRGHQPEQSLLLRHPEPQTRTQGRMELDIILYDASQNKKSAFYFCWILNIDYINYVRSILRITCTVEIPGLYIYQ